MQGFSVVFDLDGTLIDTAPDLLGCIDLLLVEKDLRPVPHGLLRPMISLGSRAMLSSALKHLGTTLAEATYEAWWQHYLTLYAEHIADRSRPFDRLIPLLDRLAAQGATLAVCTNKSEVLAHKLLDALQLSARFAAVAGRDTFPNCSKPNPEHLLGTLRMAGGQARHAVMVGDSDIDVAAARNAGVPVIAVSFGYSEHPVADYGPDAVIDHYDAFDAALAKIRQKSR